MQLYASISATSLNQSALDFKGNLKRILESIQRAKENGSCIRSGPELEITGYGCNDHFLETDTIEHSWQILNEILFHLDSQGILIDVGMPVSFKNALYNCRLICLNSKILLIRPKMCLANDGNYREMRWFVPWTRLHHVEEYTLPRFISNKNGQKTVPFGDAILCSRDGIYIGIESCEELFAPISPHVTMGLNGVDIILNASASHHEFSKLQTRVNLIQNATSKVFYIILKMNL